jgi:hypothetical protein
MIVKVEQKHINNGKACDCRLCPVALAMTEQLGMPITVGAGAWWPTNGAGMNKLPQFVIDKINDFDDDKAITPFEFSL